MAKFFELELITESLIRIRENYHSKHLAIPGKTNEELINTGDCGLWAYCVAKYTDNYFQICDVIDEYGHGHAFVVFENLYYDSEHLDGVKNWKNLNFLKETKLNKFYFTKYDDFIDFGSQWFVFDKIVDSILEYCSDYSSFDFGLKCNE